MGKKVKNGWFAHSYNYLRQGGSLLGHLLLLLIRLYWGGLLIMTGIGKWMHIEGVSQYFSSLHLPFPVFMAYFVGAVEFLGGLSLFLGLFARLFALILTLLFIVAYTTAHHAALVGIFAKPSLFIQQEPFLYLYTALVVLCFGPGFFSFDYWWTRKVYHEKI